MAYKYIVAKNVKAYAKSKGKSASMDWLERIDNVAVIAMMDTELESAPNGRKRKPKTENTPTA